MNDKCPFCEAKEDKAINGVPVYICGSIHWDKGIELSALCYERQITQLQAENETLKALRDELFERNAQLQTRIAELKGSGMVAVRREWIDEILDWVEQVREDYEGAATGPPLKKEDNWDPTTLMWPIYYNELKSALES